MSVSAPKRVVSRRAQSPFDKMGEEEEEEEDEE